MSIPKKPKRAKKAAPPTEASDNTARPDYIDEEKATRTRTQPPRKTKGFLIQPKYALHYDVLRAELGARGPDLIEEALDLLFEKYGKPLKD